MNPDPEPANHEVSRPIANQKSDLEEHHAGHPDGGTTTKHWQEHFGNIGLNQKQQKCGQTDGGCIDHCGVKNLLPCALIVARRQSTVGSFTANEMPGGETFTMFSQMEDGVVGLPVAEHLFGAAP